MIEQARNQDRRFHQGLRRRAIAAFALVEVAVAGAVLTIAVCGMSGSIVSALAVNRVNRETALAQEGLRAALERIRGATFGEAFVRHNANAADDPGGAGTAPGANFAIEGLQAAEGDADGFVGQFTFPTISVAGVPQLREDVTDAAMGMPADLNGDGAVDALNHATNYRLLPVRVTIRWRGVSGTRVLTAETVMSAH